MSEITLTKEQYMKLPYRTSTVSQGRTYGEIIGLLRDHGIKDYQFTTLGGVDVLAFPLKVSHQGKETTFTVKLTVPKLMYMMPKGKGRYSPKTITYLEKESWRIFWWYLKSKLEAIECGISDEVHEFMYNINQLLPDGSEMSLGDLIMAKADGLSKLAQLEDNSSRGGFRIPDGARVIDAEVVDEK